MAPHPSTTARSAGPYCSRVARSLARARRGWQELDFSSRVAVTAGTTYVASYHTGTGHYEFTPGGLSSAVTNGPLTALANGSRIWLP
jgi:Domain of unknown function (DUF4082)